MTAVKHKVNRRDLIEIGFVSYKIYSKVYSVISFHPKSKKKLIYVENMNTKEVIATDFPLKVYNPHVNLIKCIEK